VYLSALVLPLAVLVPSLAPSPGAPCAACVTWEMTVGQASDLLETPGDLAGVELLIRPAAGEPDPADVLTRLSARGARVGMVVRSGAPLTPAVGLAARILIQTDRAGMDVDRLAFEVKRTATESRSRSRGVEIGLETDRWEELDRRGVGPYVDFLVGSTSLAASSRRAGGPPVLLRDAPVGSGEIRAAPDDRGRTVRAVQASATMVDVVAEKPLTAEEVVARHQAAAAAQRRAMARSISSGSLVVTFQVPGLASPMTVSSDLIVYDDAGGTRELEQRDVRLNGVLYAADASGVPRLPLLEAERAGTAPLALVLDESYRYRLDGRERIEGRDCYVVAFEPAVPAPALPRGRAWIDSTGFAVIRLEARRSGLRAPIVESEQRDVFEPVPVGGEIVWLPRRSEIREVYEGAGHRTSIDRVLSFTRHEPNPADFAARLAAAHGSRAVMLRDTPRGLEYLRRTPGPGAAGTADRVGGGRATRVRAVAAGVLVDPGISRPLPFAGLSYADFDFLGTGAQVDGFFGGLFGRVAWAVPALFGSGWRAEGTASAVLVSYNDRAFRAGLERYEEGLRQRPARASIALARPLKGGLRLRVGYELDYTRLAAADTTADDFVVPASPLVHALRVGLETRQDGWTLGVWGSAARRQGWRAWGRGGQETGGASFQRFGASAARSFVLGPATVARVGAEWTGGRGLDRFSRYAFDGFENALRGYPTATIRYDEGAVVRGALSWNLGRTARLDGFLDAARVHDPGRGPHARGYVGMGAALQVPLPQGFLASMDWGYGFQARSASGGAGAHVLKVTAFKVF